MLTAAQLLHVWPNTPNPAELARAISEAWDAYGVTSKASRASFLGIGGNETGGGATIGREDMRYSPRRAAELFTKARNNPAACHDRCASVPQDRGRRFASWIYADLYGNGDEASEDGWKFRGGGIWQITFKGTYLPCGQAIGIDLVREPDLITTPKAAALAACWFMCAYKPAIIRQFNAGTIEGFLAGGALVGWTNEHHTAVRLGYRERAMQAVEGDDRPAPRERLLYLGAEPGSDVLELEQLLARRGLLEVAPDVHFDATTRAAVVAFQRRAFTAPGDHDGIAGAKTMAALRDAVKEAA